MTLGPLGVVVSHGYGQLAALERIMTATDDSTIQSLVADWTVEKGIANRGKYTLVINPAPPTRLFEDWRNPSAKKVQGTKAA